MIFSKSTVCFCTKIIPKTGDSCVSFSPFFRGPNQIGLRRNQRADFQQFIFPVHSKIELFICEQKTVLLIYLALDVLYFDDIFYFILTLYFCKLHTVLIIYFSSPLGTLQVPMSNVCEHNHSFTLSAHNNLNRVGPLM